MPGYWTDGIIDVELGEHVFASPAALRANLLLDSHCDVTRVHDSGGGVLELSVTGQRVRDNLGDAERYGYELFRALALAGPGRLGVEDQRGNTAVFGASVCVGASLEVRAFTFADMNFDFLSPEKSGEPVFGAAPATPGTYAGTDTLQDYAAGGVALGDHPTSMVISMSRGFPMRLLPRARGARARGPSSGAVMGFVVTTEVARANQSLARALETLARSIGPRPVNLTANGNTYCDVVLKELRPAHTDLKNVAIAITFVQEIGDSPFPCVTTTTEGL